MKALVITPFADAYLVELDPIGVGDQLRALVGGWIEFVGRRDRCDGFGNEEAMLRGWPLNVLARMLLGNQIRGNVVLVGPPDDEGNTTGLDDESIAMLRRLGLLWASKDHEVYGPAWSVLELIEHVRSDGMVHSL